MTTATTEQPKVSTIFANTMGHDLMVFLLATLRTMPDHWARMSQEAQEKRIAEMRESVTGIVQECANIVMRGGFQAVACELDGVTIKDEVKIGLTMNECDPQRHALYDAKGKKVLLVLAPAEDWLGKMDQIKSDKGQIDLLDSDAANYDPKRDQPGYRRDQDRVAPVGLTWEQLKNSLDDAFPHQKNADEAGEVVKDDVPELRGVTIIWPTGQREPLANHPFSIEPGETLVQALERAFPGCTFETAPADPLDRLGADLTDPLPGIIQMRLPATQPDQASPWVTLDAGSVVIADDQSIRQGLEALYPGHDFRFVPDGEARPSNEVEKTDIQPDQAALSKALEHPWAADKEATLLYEQLVAIAMPITVEQVAKLMPEQRAFVRTWLGDWSAAWDGGVDLDKLPARPHFLPVFSPPLRVPPQGKTTKRRGGKA